MPTTFKRLACWLHLWLIFTLVGTLLLAVLPAFASPLAISPTARPPEPRLANWFRPIVADDSGASISGTMNESGVWPADHEGTTTANITTPRTFPLPFNPDPASLSQRPDLIEASPKPSQLIQATPAITPSGLMFIENVGQFEAKVRFIVRSGLETLYLTDGALWFTILEQTKAPTQALKTGGDPSAPPSRRPQPKKGANLKLTFPGANPQARIEPFNRLDTHISSFIGNDPAQWRSDVPVWGGVRYVDFYPGVDLEITDQQGQLALRLALQQNAQQAVEAQGRRDMALFGAQVRLRIEGATALALESDTVRLTTAIGNFSLPLLTLVTAEGAPLTLPGIQPDLKGQEITAPFAPPETAARPLPMPHLAYPLLLSPVSQGTSRSDVLYGTYLGFNFWDDSDSQGGITVDNAGNVYGVMRIYGVNSAPTTPGAYDPTLDAVGGDLYIAKLRMDGNGAADLLYATFLGGTGGDWDAGIAVDSAGDIYVTGQTNSVDFPVVNPYQSTRGGFSDAFVVRLHPAGNGGSDLIYSTYLGKANYDQGFDVTVKENAQGQPTIYVFGMTTNADFPTTLNAYDQNYNGSSTGFVAKINPAASGQSQIEYSTFLGVVGYDSTAAGEIAVDSVGDIYIAGEAKSDTFTLTAGAVDTTFVGYTEAFLVKLRPAGAGSADLLYGTYLGGSGFDAAYSLTIDAAGNAYLGGEADGSTDFPLTAGAFDATLGGGEDGFVAKIRPDSSATNNLLYSTYLGGDDLFGFDFVSGIGVDASGKIYIIGYTESTGFPTTSDASQPTLASVYYQDGFMAKLDPNLSGQEGLLYGSYLGGVGDDFFFDLAVDAAGNAYVVGGTWGSTDLPTTGGAYDPTYNGSGSGYVAKLRMGNSNGRVTVDLLDPQGNPITDTLALNTDGWPTPNPLTVRMTITNTTGATLTNPALALTINSPYTSSAYTGRFHVLETNGFGGGVYGGSTVQYNKVVTNVQTLTISQTTVLTAQVWVQPSITTTLSITAELYSNAASVGQSSPLGQDTTQVSVPKANIRPVIFIPGYLATFPPDYGPDYGGDGKIDPVLKFYDNLLNALERAGYEKGLADSGATLITFPYDWRQSLGNTGSITLTAHIQRVQNTSSQKAYVDYSQVDLITHSAGGLVARAYLENTSISNDQTVHTLLTLGSPHSGVPGAYLGWYGGDPSAILAKDEFVQLQSALIFCESDNFLSGGIGAWWNQTFPPEDFYDYFRGSAPSIEGFMPRADYITPSYLIGTSGITYPYPSTALPADRRPPSSFLDDLNTANGLFDITKLQSIPSIISSYSTYYATRIQFEVGSPPNPASQERPDFWKYGTFITHTTGAGDAVVPDYSGNLRTIAPYTNIVAQQEQQPPGVTINPNDRSTWPPTHMELIYRPHIIRRVISYTIGIDISQLENFWKTEYIVPDENEQYDVATSCSPVRIRVTDPLGRRAGLNLSTGQVINEIPGAFVTEDGIDPQIILLPQINGRYQLEGIGVDQGEYRVGVIRGTTNPIVVAALGGMTTVGQQYQLDYGEPLPQENGGQVVLEAEEFVGQIGRSNRSWLTQTILSGYSGSSYTSSSPDTDLTFTSTYTIASPELQYAINFSTPGTYYIWLRGYTPNGAGDSVYVSLDNQPATTLTGFVPREWSWTAKADNAQVNQVSVEVTAPGVHTLHLWMREDGLKLDRILLTTDSGYTPSGNGP